MLNPGLDRRTLTRRVILITAVALLGVTLPVAAFHAAAQNAPLALSGSVYDASGAVLPQVDLTLEDAQQVKHQAALRSGSAETFAYRVSSMTPGRCIRRQCATPASKTWSRSRP